ncbi:TRAP transporter substrate-binding protein [Falsiroseomonas selenitidurans]|uniref:TRAP transporter substrate-binding protein n=1 Tax=Falsiroseomonas selenitidurans TaxID=2716335 RepID=A0ABX1E0N1_9PROT|nr:TRAP transporter substrate-binding protein [Falsiroseomonas selenitidurans]NKC30704.1 TRAP transporter substrate-binding protein [Falsiroseomonas selenitidurans]
MILSRRGLLAASLAMPAAAQAQATRWQFATPYPDGNFHTRNIRAFIQAVEAASDGRLGITLHGNGSLLPLPQIKRGVQTGQVQLGEILISAYGNEDPLLEVDSIPQLVTSYPEARKLADLTRPMLEARLARQGLSLLYTVPWPPSGFYTNTPVETLEALRGTRMRTFNVMTNRFATLIGATPTLVQAAEIPQAFATGVVNAMVTSAATGVDSAAWDYAKFFTPIGFTWTKNAVFVNRRALEALPADLQAKVREAAAAAETRGWAMSAQAQQSAQATLAARGMTVATASPALMQGMARIGAAMAAEWVGRAGADGQRVLDGLKAAG